MKSKFHTTTFVSSFVIVILVAAIGSFAMGDQAKSGWYSQIKPAITPPNWVFGPVWTLLFILIAISLGFAWDSAKDKRQRGRVVLTYGLNFFFNVSWSVLYFGLHDPGVAFVDLVALWISIVAMLGVTWRRDVRAAYLLLPYLLWVTFAGVLNFLSIG
jgi:tryptophan-rich sensory protein